MIGDAGIRRLLADLDATGHKDCARAGCTYPAVLDGLCGFHKGRDLASRQEPQAFKPESDKPRSPRRTLA